MGVKLSLGKKLCGVDLNIKVLIPLLWSGLGVTMQKAGAIFVNAVSADAFRLDLNMLLMRKLKSYLL